MILGGNSLWLNYGSVYGDFTILISIHFKLILWLLG
nr:MAG TPA: hypothetical protein [Caudoviricetes sp.]